MAETERNVMSAKKDFRTDLNTLIMETTCDEDLIASLMGIEMKNDGLIPDDHFRFHKRKLTLFDVFFLDDKIFVHSGMQEWIPETPIFSQTRETKRIAASRSRIYCWPGTWYDILDKKDL